MAPPNFVSISINKGQTSPSPAVIAAHPRGFLHNAILQPWLPDGEIDVVAFSVFTRPFAADETLSSREKIGIFFLL